MQPGGMVNDLLLLALALAVPLERGAACVHPKLHIASPPTMLERFTEKARRVIFYARYEASQYGSPAIETEHLLLGLLREDKFLAAKFLKSHTPRSIRQEIEARTGVRERISTSSEVPLSMESKRILARAAEEAAGLGDKHVDAEHLFLAILQEAKSFAAQILAACGLRYAEARELVAQLRPDQSRQRASHPANIEEVDEQSRAVPRAGMGYDLHRLEPGRKLMLGGIEVPFDRGSVGHSDGDVLIHAICDALLGAAGLGDIGTHFPDTDAKWKNASSLQFLEHIRGLLAQNGLSISHIDTVVIAERPKLGPHFPGMREAMSRALGIETRQINLKAKTNEGVDAIGRGEAIAAQAIATLI
jgi:2-C-methyl-D-erythritol 2,4-cyclodiphosphate synthase